MHQAPQLEKGLPIVYVVLDSNQPLLEPLSSPTSTGLVPQSALKGGNSVLISGGKSPQCNIEARDVILSSET